MKVDLKKQQIVYLKKRPTGFRRGGTTADINLTAINENVQSEFFKQYFKEVNYVNEAKQKIYLLIVIYITINMNMPSQMEMKLNCL